MVDMVENRKQTRSSVVLLAAAATVAIAGCSNTASNLLTTGSVFGASKPGVPKQKVITPTDRALQVATVSARAQKCGYAFNPGQLRQAFFAAETAAGLPADQLVGLQQRYDFTTNAIAKAIAPNSGYCDRNRTQIIKADLNRHLAGDFSPRIERAKPVSGWFETDEPQGKEVINHEHLLDPHEPMTKRVEE